MMYSMTCCYAIRAMCQLAILHPQGYVRIRDVCKGTELPADFVSKIFRQLVAAGLLVSARGRGGGYALARSASQIYLYDIVETIDGVKPYNRCVLGLSTCDDKQPCPQHELFKPVRKRILGYLRQTSLDQMSQALENRIGTMVVPAPGGSAEQSAG